MPPRHRVTWTAAADVSFADFLLLSSNFGRQASAATAAFTDTHDWWT